MIPPIENLLLMAPEMVTSLLLAEPEGQWFDRKSSRISARDLSETLVAMANAEGGIVAVGLHGGVCEGADAPPKNQNSWRQAGFQFTDPPVRYTSHLLPCINHLGHDDHIFAIQIRPSNQVHSTAKDDVFLRVGDQNRKLSFDQRMELRYDKGDTSFERTSVPNSLQNKLDPASVDEYCMRLGHPDPSRVLEARDLVDDNGLPYTAGLLLFGEDPQRAYPQAYVRVVKYSGRERGSGTTQNLVSDDRCEGRLPQQIDQAREAMRRAIPQRRLLGPNGRFGWVDIVPEEVWMEGLVNAVIHRAYSNFGDHIRLEVFDDRIEISSPGRFPGITSLDDLTEVRRFARNPRIARVMSDLSYGQELGEGLRRMVSVMEESGRERPVVQQRAAGVSVTLVGRVVGSRELARLPIQARALYRQLAAGGRCGTGELVLSSGYSRPVVLRYLKLLQSRGLIHRVAKSPSDPRAYWTAETSS